MCQTADFDHVHFTIRKLTPYDNTTLSSHIVQIYPLMKVT